MEGEVTVTGSTKFDKYPIDTLTQEKLPLAVGLDRHRHELFCVCAVRLSPLWDHLKFWILLFGRFSYVEKASQVTARFWRFHSWSALNLCCHCSLESQTRNYTRLVIVVLKSSRQVDQSQVAWQQRTQSMYLGHTKPQTDMENVKQS